MNLEKVNQGALKRTIGLFSSILLVIGIVIGSGVFKKIVPMAQTGLGEVGIISAWVAAGLITLFGALTVAGLATVTEESGGTYEYYRIGFGNFISFLAGWSEFTIIGSGSVAALSFLFGQALDSFVHIPNPFESLTHVSIANFIFPFEDFGIKIVGIASIVVLTTVNYLGTKEGTNFNSIITSVKILGLTALIVLGFTYSPTMVSENLSSIELSNSQDFIFISAFFSAMLGAFWSYDGWVATTYISGEIKNPKKNVPLAIFFGVLIVMLIYVLVNYSFLQVLTVDEIRKIGDNEIGAMVVAKKIFGDRGDSIILVLIIVSVFGALNGSVITYPRKYFRMAQEKFFFFHASKVHSKFNTPHIALLYSGVVSCILLVSGSFDLLTDMVIFTGFIFYGLLAVALIKLKRNGTIKNKVIGYPYIPILFLLFSIALTINTIWAQPKLSLIGVLLILTGIPFYYLFKLKSKL